MQTISEEEFLKHFLKISQDLTYAELRMLYLLITKPNVIDLPQQIFASTIQVHRRTINIGLKKLRKLNYIHEINSFAEPSVLNNEEGAIQKHELASAKQVVENSIEDYYAINDKTFTINEDYFSFILGDIRLPPKFRHNKTFVIDTISEKFSEVRFYFDLKESDYKDKGHYHLIGFVNSEIITARSKMVYRINIEKKLQEKHKIFSIEKEEAMRIICAAFPKIRLTKKYISLRRPYNAIDNTAYS